MENVQDSHIFGLLCTTFNIISEKENEFDDAVKPSIRHEARPFNKYIIDCYKTWVTNKVFIFDENAISNLDQVYNILSDEESKNVFDWLIMFKITSILTRDFNTAELLFPYPVNNDDSIEDSEIKSDSNSNSFNVSNYKIYSESFEIIETWIYENYLLNGRCEPEQGDVVIDAGAFKGETSIWFADKTGINGKVFAFEIVKSHLDLLVRNVKRNKLEDIIEIIDKGLLDENKSVFVSQEGGASSCSDYSKELIADVIKLDTFIEENHLEKIDFIKMDIEGSELAALKGAAGAIRMHKPKLAICIYHKYEDIFEIPLFIKSLVPDYKIFISHKVPYSFGTVLFATT